jgi:hypothetical protein
METRSIWTDLIPDTGLKIAEVFNQAQEEYLPGIFSVLRSGTGDGAQKNYRGKTGIGRLKKFDEGDDISEAKRYPSYLTKEIYNQYGSSVTVTKVQIEDRDFDAELDEMRDLGIAANFSKDEAGVQMFNGGFSTTADVNGYTINWYGDAVPQFSTVHPTQVPGGSTQSNASATGIKFGHDNLETGHIALIQQKTDDGIPMSMMGKVSLVVPTALLREAREEGESTLTPESAENAINVYKGTQDIVTSVLLDATNSGSDTAWFLTVPERARMYHVDRQGAVLEQDTDIRSKNVTFTVDARWANVSRDWRRTWGSKGDLASYSS